MERSVADVITSEIVPVVRVALRETTELRSGPRRAPPSPSCRPFRMPSTNAPPAISRRSMGSTRSPW